MWLNNASVCWGSELEVMGLSEDSWIHRFHSPPFQIVLFSKLSVLFGFHANKKETQTGIRRRFENPPPKQPVTSKLSKSQPSPLWRSKQTCICVYNSSIVASHWRLSSFVFCSRGDLGSQCWGNVSPYLICHNCCAWITLLPQRNEIVRGTSTNAMQTT